MLLDFTIAPRQYNRDYVNYRRGFVNDAQAKSQSDDLPPWHFPEQAAAFVLALGFFTTIGPFGTFEMPFLWRLSYWFMALGAGWVFVSCSLVGLRQLGYVHTDAPALRVAIAILLAALPTAVAVLAIESVMRPTDGPFWNLKTMAYVALVCLVIGGVVYGFVRHRFTRPETAPASGPDTAPHSGPAEPPAHATFLRRLPPQLGSDLISLSSQDHYVEVTTENGRELIHMRLSDALHELRDFPGQQIHRSHWIAARAFRGLSRENGKLMAHLSDDRRLVVSRSFTAAARDMSPVMPPAALKNLE